MRKAVVILPTYNEEGNIERLIELIFAQQKNTPNWELHILVVDSKSTDNTEVNLKKLMKRFPRLYLRKVEKEGLGKAYVNGFKTALQTLQPFVIFEMDADLSHDPKEIPEFLKEIEKGADFVIGSRYIRGGSIPSAWELHRKFLSVFGNIIIRLGFMKLSISDWTGGFRAIKTWIVKDSLEHIKNYSGYVFQVALLDYAINHSARVKEIPINFGDRTVGVSKINAAQYSLHSLMYVFNHSSFIKYIIVGGSGFLVDSFLLYVGYHMLRLDVKVAKVISAETAILSNFLFNNFWAFSHKRLEHKLEVYAGKFLKFNLVSVPSIIIQTVGIVVLTVVFGKYLFYPIGYNILIVGFIVIPYSYFMYNQFIWKK